MRRADRGFTLVEVLVAFVVLELGLLGAVGLLVAASQALGRAVVLEHASQEASAVADSLSRAGVSGAGEVRRGAWRIRWEPDAGGSLRVSAEPHTGGAAGAVLFVP